jgi:hypothetical protein
MRDREIMPDNSGLVLDSEVRARLRNGSPWFDIQMQLSKRHGLDKAHGYFRDAAMPGVMVISVFGCGIAVALPGGSVMLPPWLCLEASERATINASWLSSFRELPGAGRMCDGVASAVGLLLKGTDIAMF